MVKQLKIRKSAFMLKINLHVLITKYPKLKNLFLSINYFKHHFNKLQSLVKQVAALNLQRQFIFCFIKEFVHSCGTFLHLRNFCIVVELFHTSGTFPQSWNFPHKQNFPTVTEPFHTSGTFPKLWGTFSCLQNFSTVARNFFHTSRTFPHS